MAAIRRAQTAFRTANGTGFATDLESLQRPCPGHEALKVAVPASDAVGGYAMTLRGAKGGRDVGVDCHGRPTTSDYYAAVAPAPGRSDGRRAYAMTSQGPVFVFFDGIAPTEADMAPGGLATPLDTLDTFRIP